MRFDDVLTEIGDFGPYQRRVFALICIVLIPSSWPNLIQVFAMGGSDHWCKIPEWNATICEELGNSAEACRNGTLLKLTSIPLVDSGNGTDPAAAPEYQQCARYNTSDLSLLYITLDSNDTTTSYASLDAPYATLDAESRGIIPCDSGWDYDKSVYTRTVIQEQDLVCGGAQYIQIPQAVHYAGYLAGSFMFGLLADTIGRHKALLIVLLMTILSGFSHLLFVNYWAFVAIRFVQGMASIGAFMLCFVLGTEFVGSSKRNIAGIFVDIPYAFGYIILAGIAYFIRDWRTLNIALTVPWIPIAICLIFVPESARWLLSQGRTEQAEKIMRKAASVNKIKLPEKLFEGESAVDELSTKVKGGEKKPNFLDIFRHPNMRLRTLLLMYLWSVCAVVYHGLSLSTSTLGINVYISFLVSGAIEIPAYALSIVIIELPWFGRRRSTAITFLVGGIACLLTIFIAPGAARATVGTIGKFGVTAAFGIIYLYTAELYPTPLRAIGLGLCSMAGRVANILAPMILLTSQYWEPAPLVIFGSATVLAGFLSFILPETRGRRLPETVQDGEMFGRSNLNQEPNDSQTNGEGENPDTTTI